MRALALLAVLVVVSCASIDPRPYRACLKDSSGYLTTGTVLSEHFDVYGRKVFRFQADRLPIDGRHVMEVFAVLRSCRAAQGVTPSAEDKGPRGDIPSQPEE